MILVIYKEGVVLPILPFESKEDRVKREMKKLAYEIAQEAARNFNYDPDNDPVLRDFRRKMGLPLKKAKKR